MTGNSKYDDDDYVAKLLAEDAKKSSQRYAAVGLSALLPKRPTQGVPKPNTRFLSHLVREADSHNAALKRKEETEARTRLREMREQDKSDRHKENEDHRRKRRRLDEDDPQNRRHGHRRDDRSSDRNGKQRHRHERSSNRRISVSPDSDRRDSHRDDHRKSNRSRNDPTERYRAKGIRYENSKDHNRSHRHRSPNLETTSKDLKLKRSSHKHQRESSTSSSDPLSPLLSPKPTSAPPIRGRGAHRPQPASNIDAHFSSTYNPSLDVHPEHEADSDREDWDMALEALRDRAMWKSKQSERMREAGFGDEEIKRWEKGTGSGKLGDGAGDGDIRDVKWKRKGEAREWDLGKKGVD